MKLPVWAMQVPVDHGLLPGCFLHDLRLGSRLGSKLDTAIAVYWAIGSRIASLTIEYLPGIYIIIRFTIYRNLQL